MTDGTASPAQGASLPEPSQASLRAELAEQIASAQSELEGQLAELQRASGDSSLTSELQGQLHVLQALGQFLSTAHGASLSQIRVEVATSVAAARSITQQAQTTVAAAHASEAAKQAAEYATATAELDRKVADTFAIDRDNNALAHAMAKRFGIDLSETDAERNKLEAEKRAAVASGDKLAEREVDVRLAQNTYTAMNVAGERVTDPDERSALEKAKQEQKKVVETRSDALAAQRELTNGRSANELPATTPLRKDANVEQSKVQKTTDTAKADFADFTSSLTLELTPQIALSDAANAHTNIEVPKTITSSDKGPQSRA